MAKKKNPLELPKFLDRKKWTKARHRKNDAMWAEIEADRVAEFKALQEKSLQAAQERREEEKRQEEQAQARKEEDQARSQRVGARKDTDKDVHAAIMFDGAKTVKDIMEKTGITDNWDVRRALQRLKKAKKVEKHPDNRLWWRAK